MSNKKDPKIGRVRSPPSRVYFRDVGRYGNTRVHTPSPISIQFISQVQKHTGSHRSGVLAMRSQWLFYIMCSKVSDNTIIHIKPLTLLGNFRFLQGLADPSDIRRPRNRHNHRHKHESMNQFRTDAILLLSTNQRLVQSDCQLYSTMDLIA